MCIRDRFHRAQLKLSGAWKLVLRDITRDAANINRKEHAFKKKDLEAEKPKEEVAGAAAPGAEGAPTAVGAGEKGEKTAGGAPAAAAAKGGAKAEKKAEKK